jgi:cell division protein FtsQ
MTAGGGRASAPARDARGQASPGAVGAAAGRSGPAGQPAIAPDAGAARQGRPGGRRPVLRRGTVLAGAAALLVVAVIWALLGSSVLVVRSVHAAGTRLVPRSRIIAAAGIARGTPMIRIDSGAIARRIERIPQVASALVRRQWPATVVITVQDRVPGLAVRQGSAFALIDGSGVVVLRSATRPAGLPLLTGTPSAALRGSPAVSAAAAIVRQLPAALRRRVAEVRAPAADAVTLVLRGGTRIAWGGTDRDAAKDREVTALLRKHASFYDVSSPGTAVAGG